MLPQPRRRWACFPGSVISDHDNPAAHLYRATARHIAALQDEARFYEERANPWLRNMLLNEGAAAFRTFQERYPDVSYVTYEPRTGAHLADWLNNVLATVDIVLVDRLAPRDIVRWIGELTRPHLQTFLVDTRGETGSDDDVPESIGRFTGICVAEPDDRHPSISVGDDQYLIRFGPVQVSSISNGDAARHVDQSASNLVTQVAAMVDETLIRNQDETI